MLIEESKLPCVGWAILAFEGRKAAIKEYAIGNWKKKDFFLAVPRVFAMPSFLGFLMS